MKSYFLLFSFCFVALGLFAKGDLPFSEFKFGEEKEVYKFNIKDISLNHATQESKFQYLEKMDLLGTNPTSVDLDFWNNRLFSVNFTFSSSDFEKILKSLNQEYGKSWSYSGDSSSWNWDLKTVKIRSSNAYGTNVVSFSDESQKDFHFADLFKGMVLWVLISIVGLFVVYWFITWLFSSYCNKCKTFNMKYQEISLENPTNYSHMDGIQIIYDRPDFHYDKVYKFKCNKCGNTRDERYSSWWSWYGSKNK